jgi:hypothetical protein
MTLRAYKIGDDKPLKEGDRLTDFRADTWFFVGLTLGGRRIHVRQNQFDTYGREFYPAVFDLIVREEK